MDIMTTVDIGTRGNANIIQLRASQSEKPTVQGGRQAKEAYRTREYLTEAEIERLLEAAGKSRNPTRDRLLVLLAFRHALRVSELVDVKVEQIDLKAATIHIRRAKNVTPGIHGLQGDEFRLIRALLREQPNSTFLFLSERKAPLSVDGVQKLVERLGVAARFAFPIHAHIAAPFGWLRPGEPRRRYAHPPGVLGPPLDIQHGDLPGRGRQARPQYLGEIAMLKVRNGQASEGPRAARGLD